MAKKEKMKYYTLDRILSFKCLYNLIYGERSNGKTFAVHKYMLKNYIEKGEQSALLRRWEKDFTGRLGESTFDGVVNAGIVRKITKEKWTGIKYYAGRWYLARFDDKLNKVVTSEEPFCYAFALTGGEHYKSTSYSRVTTILFDEFLTRESYLPKEFVKFQNILCTIIRQRDDVTIFMLGNTVNKYCPYFEEMGIRDHIGKMKGGDIEIVSYGDSGLTMAIEYTLPTEKGKLSDKYFAFNNPQLQMITKGVWEMAMYPHLPYDYKRSDVQLDYFIKFDGELLHCEIIYLEDVGKFTYIHRKTSPIKRDTDIVFSVDFSPSPYRFRKITRPKSYIEKTIAWYYANDRIFYQSNEVGEIIRNYLKWCKSDDGLA